jgi:hypothetical protein
VEEYIENQRRHYIVPMEALFSEVNRVTGKKLELHPFFGSASQQAYSLYTGYKLHERSSVDRTLIVLIDEFEYVPDSDGNWGFRPEAAGNIKSEIEDFWQWREH